jgi:hypothetical protein
MAQIQRHEQFPSYWSAPYSLLRFDGPCGLISVWGVLKYFKKRRQAAYILEACRYTKKYGTFTVAMATALRRRGLSVTFYTERDNHLTKIEQQCYRLAVELGVHIKPALQLTTLMTLIDDQHIAILYFNTSQGQGHFSPCLGQARGKLILPYTQETLISKRDFLPRWANLDNLRQALIVSR